MISKPKIINEITAKCTIKTLPTIKGEPGYEAINEMMQIVYANTATLKMPQGWGHHGNIFMIMNPTLYTTLSTTECTNPPVPGVYPTVPTNATTDHQDQLQLQYDKG